MRIIWICCCLIATQIHGQVGVSENSGEKVEESFPSELTTKKGTIYRDCKLKRIESDALIVAHRGGIAKISFFDLDESFQKKYGFDPIAAMEKYRASLKTQRDLKWKRFWEAQKHEVGVVVKEDRQKFLKTVKATWIPVEARVVKHGETGSYVQASRITFVRTKAKSSLGFEIDGPLRKKLVPMTPNVIFIKAAGIKGEIWQGYLEPHSHGSTGEKLWGSDDEVPSYRAVARTEIK
jgi:hypothetical protein